MTKDDYHVIVFQILTYLYNCLKKDLEVQEENLKSRGKLFKIPERYWSYILVNLQKEKYIDGVVFQKAWGEQYPIVDSIEGIDITPLGIEYLIENNLMNKAKRLLKDTKAIIPFI